MNFITEFGSWNLKTYSEAENLAAVMGMHHPELLFLPCENREGRIVQYSIITAPFVGDAVSQSYNGHTFPAGKVEDIDHGYERIKANGKWYTRLKKQPSWVSSGWYLVKGNGTDYKPESLKIP